MKLEPTPLSVLGFPRYFRSSRQGCSIQPVSSLSYQWNRHFRRILAFIRKIAVAVSIVLFMFSLPPVAAGAGLDGRWEGKIDRSGKLQAISVDITLDDNGWQGFVDIPEEAVRGGSLQQILFHAGSVHFETQVMGVQLSFEGKLEGDKITGTFSLRSEKFPFFLERKSAASSLGRSSSRSSEQSTGNQQPVIRGQKRFSTQEDTHLIELEEVTRKGADYALLFASDEYDSWDHLNNPLSDAEAIARELRETYGFQTEVVPNPNRDRILDTIERYREKKYGEEDQLLIFFAGHGFYSEKDMSGFIVTKTSKRREEDPYMDSFISHTMLRNRIDTIGATHILLILDSCFSGTIDPKLGDAGHRGPPPKDVSDLKFVKRFLKFPTRRYLTSGGKEYVSDGIPGHNSPFASSILEALRSYSDNHRVLTYYNLIDGVRRATVDEKAQPRQGTFGNNEPGSDFFFIVNLPSPASPKN